MVNVGNVEWIIVFCVLCLITKYVIFVELVSCQQMIIDSVLRSQIVRKLMQLVSVICLRCIMSHSARHVLLRIVFCVRSVIHSCVMYVI